MGRSGDGSLIKSISYPINLTRKDPKSLKSFMELLTENAMKEGKSLSEITVELWKKYLKEHQDGNFQYKLTQFNDDSF
jgi:hypothetical protein